MLPDKGLESRIAELKQEFGDLFDDRTLKRIALDELGMPMADLKKIKELKDREEVTIEIEVTKIADSREFEKRTGGKGRVRNLSVRDDSGTCRLALWDADVDMVESEGIQIGTKLRCTDCYVKHTDFGLDLSKGKKGKIEII